MSTLVIAAHPDDEVLGCGGTIAKRSAAGEAVFIVILGEGMTSRTERREDADPAAVNTLHARSAEVAELLGARDLFMFSLPDNRFDTVPMLEVVKHIEQLIGRLQPSVVYTQHGGDLNIDHVVTYRATLTATRPVPGSPVQTVYSYEVASSTEWAFDAFSPRFTPQVFEDITETLDTKIRAMQTYESEARAFPHPRAPEALRARATALGAQIGVTAAEAFAVVRELRR